LKSIVEGETRIRESGKGDVARGEEEEAGHAAEWDRGVL
jgi:hypothetical protein